MRTDLFDFELPPERIALRPARPRDAARLLVVRPGRSPNSRISGPRSARSAARRRRARRQRHQGDPGAAHGRRIGRGARSRRSRRRCISGSTARAGAPLSSPAKRLAPGDVVRFGDEGKVCFLGQLDASVEAKGEGGEITLAFAFHGPVLDQAIDERGDMPLPPYIASRRAPDEHDRTDYQTMFAHDEGSVAAPTAGLHFTDALMAASAARAASASHGHAACRRRNVPAGQGRRYRRAHDACRMRAA